MILFTSNYISSADIHKLSTQSQCIVYQYCEYIRNAFLCLSRKDNNWTSHRWNMQIQQIRRFLWFEFKNTKILNDKLLITTIYSIHILPFIWPSTKDLKCTSRVNEVSISYITYLHNFRAISANFIFHDNYDTIHINS